MAITYPLALPSVGFRRMSLRAHSAVGVGESPFTYSQQVYVQQGECWEADVELPPMRRADAEPWVAFLLAMNGREGTFLMGEPLNASPRGVGTGTPVVNTGLSNNKTLFTRGWTINTTGILKAGDWLQLGSGSSAHLHKVVQDATSTGIGHAELDIWPRLRTSYADGAAVTIASPRGLWRLTSNQRDWSIELAQLYGLSFSAREAL